MDVTQVLHLVSALRQDILRAFKQWADSVPDADKPFIGTASGELFSPRQIVEHIERQTPEGEEFVQDWIRVAINKATLEMLQPTVHVAGVAAAEAREGDKLSMNVADLKLSVRATDCLKSEGIATVRDLVKRSEDELLDIRNFGILTLREVNQKLSERGLTLSTKKPRRE